MPKDQNNLEEEQEGGKSLLSRRRLLIIIIVIAAIIILVTLGLIFGKKLFVKNTGNLNETQNISLTNNKPSNTNFSAILVNTAKDADSDGLSDEEENKLGTDPNNKDTDSDGLSDFDEVKKYMTNPNNKDTDGDGISDGDEVARGLNPKGAGKLLDINRALNNQSQ